MGVGSSLLATLRWYRDAQRREYAAERDFQHLKRDYESLSKMVIELDDKSDKLAAAIVEMRGAISVLLKRSKTAEG